MHNKLIYTFGEYSGLVCEIFEEKDKLYQALTMGNKELIDSLIDRFNKNRLRDSNLGYISLYLNINNLIYFDNEYRDSDIVASILNKLPYSSLETLKLILILFILETDDILCINRSFVYIKERTAGEFLDILDTEDYFKIKFIYTVRELLLDSNILYLLNLVLPNYKQLIPENKHINYWPFRNNSIEHLLRQGLSTYNFNKSTAIKLCLISADRKYNNIDLSEAITLLILKRILDEGVTNKHHWRKKETEKVENGGG